MTTACWNETHLSTVLAINKFEDICNSDEFALFFQSLQSKTLEMKEEKCSGQHSTVRLTGMCAGIATNKKLPLVVIG